jgi:hypothetical protein
MTRGVVRQHPVVGQQLDDGRGRHRLGRG